MGIVTRKRFFLVLLLSCLAVLVVELVLAYSQVNHRAAQEVYKLLKDGQREEKENKSQFHTKSIDNNSNTDRRPPLILMWNTFWGEHHWYLDLDKMKGMKKRVQGCRINCEVTSYRYFYLQSSAVVVWGLDPFDSFPLTRPPWQRVVLFNLEPPDLFKLDSKTRETNLFNMTMSYRRDSDIVTYASDYLVKLNQKNVFFNQSRDYAIEKSKLVVWIVSNCHHTTSKRNEFVQNLQKFIQVDIFGKCGKPCDDCAAVARAYKFYLAFENSMCRQYAQKIWKTEWDSVPVVLGGENYSSILPPHSYIDVADFESPEALAKYLHLVASNDTLYNSYFAYKQDYEVIDFDKIGGMQSQLCRLCEKLAHNETLPSKSYPDVYSWWHKGTCWSPEEQYPHLKRYFKV